MSIVLTNTSVTSDLSHLNKQSSHSLSRVTSASQLNTISNNPPTSAVDDLNNHIGSAYAVDISDAAKQAQLTSTKSNILHPQPDQTSQSPAKLRYLYNL